MGRTRGSCLSKEEESDAKQHTTRLECRPRRTIPSSLLNTSTPSAWCGPRAIRSQRDRSGAHRKAPSLTTRLVLGRRRSEPKGGATSSIPPADCAARPNKRTDRPLCQEIHGDPDETSEIADRLTWAKKVGLKVLDRRNRSNRVEKRASCSMPRALTNSRESLLSLRPRRLD
jgi:hypothetical protein